MPTTPTYVSPFTGTVVTPTDVSYYSLAMSTNQELFWPSSVNGEQVPAARIIDAVASVTGLTITFPQANQGSVGADILIRNLGLYPITILNFDGGASVPVNPGIAIYFYLSDNSTTAGVWQNVTFGAGTSSADAASLAGAGLTALNGKLAVSANVVDVTTNPVINNNSRSSTYNWNGGVGTFNLPDTATLSNGWYISFRNNGTGALSITPIYPQQINTTATITAYPGDSGYIIYDSNSGNYITTGFATPTDIVFTAATYDVDSIVGNTFSLVSYAPIIQTYVAQSGTRTQSLLVTLPAITQLYILVNNTNQSGYTINFQNEGSLQAPYSLQVNSVVILLSDGTNLYPLTESTTGVFLAADGSAAAPSYSFNADTSTGMYLQGSGILGLSANGDEIIDIDNSNTLDPIVTINATLNAEIITGGAF